MRLIVIGCEHTGKTTLAQRIRAWISEMTGDPGIGIHDHFLPHIGEGAPGRFTSEEEEEQFFSLKPFALEKYTRYMIHYHLGHHFYLDNDHLLVNWYYGDVVYAPLYFGFGGAGQYADRRSMARSHDAEIMAMAPDTVLVHLRASVDVIRRRMETVPVSRFRQQDIELVLSRFEEEFASSLIRRRFVLDTTSASPEETFQAFLQQIEPHLTQVDRLRILTHQSLQALPLVRG